MHIVSYSNDTGSLVFQASTEEELAKFVSTIRSKEYYCVYIDLLNFLCRSRYTRFVGELSDKCFIVDKMYNDMITTKEIDVNSYKKVFEEDYEHIKIRGN